MATRKAVIVGVGQCRRNPKLDGPFVPTEPAAMMAEAVRRAADDCAGLGGGRADELLRDATALACVDPISWAYDDLCATVADHAGMTRGVEGLTVPPGGNSPGDLLHMLATAIIAGDTEIAVLAGSETLYGRRRAMKEGLTLDWTPHDAPRDFLKGQRPLTTTIEARHGLTAPIHCYPLFENALRHADGRTVPEHEAFLGRLMARNTKVAAANPFAWFPTEYSPTDLSAASADNRMVCFPYPKRLNAIMEVDLSAAVIVMSSDEATRRGIPVEHQVAFVGGASAVDAWTPCERADFVSSPAIRAAAARAFDHAGLVLGDIDLFDFYSCFPSAVQLALRELGLGADDRRGVTVTGGLAYAGGPGNSYSLHALAAMSRRLRSGEAEVTTGLVTSLGMTATKHAYSVLSVDPSKVASADGAASKLGTVDVVAPALVDERSGDAVVETYTAEFDRTGEAVRTVFVLRLADGSRTVANGSCSPDEVRALTTIDLVGRSGHVVGGSAAVGDANVPNRFRMASA